MQARYRQYLQYDGIRCTRSMAPFYGVMAASARPDAAVSGEPAAGALRKYLAFLQIVLVMIQLDAPSYNDPQAATDEERGDVSSHSVVVDVTPSVCDP
jgi:hypothetical protein